MLVPLELLREKPLQQQIYDQLRQLIVSGRLSPGVRMPSTRMLSGWFAISRITVVMVYERLVAEGYLRTHPTSGTFVAEATSCHPRPCGNDMERPPKEWAKAADTPVGRPDPELFPVSRWRACMRRAIDGYPPRVGCESAGGLPMLRRAITEWLAATRGLTVLPERVVVVSSRRRGFELALHLLRRPSQRVVIEAPADEIVAAAYAGAAVRLVRVPVDAEGIDVERLPSTAVALAHLCPARQRPLGVALSLQRRQPLIDWAERVGATILEEDCDGDLRYEPAPAPPLMAPPNDDRVIYAGSFAATLGPGVSLSYIVLPERLISAAVAARPLIDDRPAWLEEAALADFISSGSYARHVHRLRKIYGGRRASLLKALQCQFGPVEVYGSQAGLGLAWILPPLLGSASDVAAMACRAGIGARAMPRSAGMRQELIDRVVLLDYAAGSERGLREAVASLATAISERGIAHS
jgi:GntR family transcriptional regulator/MocR family aminotransferase